MTAWKDYELNAIGNPGERAVKQRMFEGAVLTDPPRARRRPFHRIAIFVTRRTTDRRHAKVTTGSVQPTH